MSRTGEIHLRARDRALQRDLDRAERQVGRFGNRVKTTLGSSFKGGLTTVGSFAAVGGLSNQESARRGNLYGIIGMVIALVATAAQPDVTGYGVLAAAIVPGAIVGAMLAARVAMTSMPEHSL